MKLPMKALVASAILASAALAACSSSNTTPPAPRSFAGNWVGSADGDSVSLTATQTDTTVTGGGVAVISGTTFEFTLTGTSKDPSITLTASLPCAQTVTFTGSYVSADSVAGTLTDISGSIPFGLKKQ